MPREPYNQDMRDERATMPPSAAEREGVERFESEARTQADNFMARAYEAARRLGILK
jgi:hypothetical protein